MICEKKSIVESLERENDEFSGNQVLPSNRTPTMKTAVIPRRVVANAISAPHEYGSEHICFETDQITSMSI